MFVPSKGSTATSTRGPYPVPNFSPIYSIGASSISPSPITTVPFIGACNKLPWSAIAMTARAFQPPAATMFVPSKGSTATSTRGPYPVPNFSPIYSIGASSISPSPITTVPFIGIVSNTSRIADVAAPSASSFFPRPIQRADDKAAASVTRTNSIDKLLSTIIPLL
ncbi:Uncharacterised protein [Streptococcus pneumoniae]|nr:Uncharacterised protein [Streptococcus pneumoniae]